MSALGIAADAKQFVSRKYVQDLVHHKARQLARRDEFQKDAIEDLEQELLLDLLERLPDYDPERATLDTFAADCVGHKVSDMIRERKTEMRDSQREGCSLDTRVRDEDGVSVNRGETMSREEDDKRLCELLKTMPLATAARRLGIPRTTAAYHVQKIREVFHEAGLQDYL
jgi:RNA polymerase sigma-70 factor (ECF subfamily)